MPSIVFTALVSQSSVWLNAVAPLNMDVIFSTALVVQLSGRLNAVANANT